MNHKVDWSLNAFAGRNYSDIIFIGGNRVGTGYFRNVGNTRRLGTEFALNGKLGKKWSWFAKVVRTLTQHLKPVKIFRV